MTGTAANIPQKADVLARACSALSLEDEVTAKAIVVADYPFVGGASAQRRYSLQDMLRTFYRDGFLDRYSGTRLIHPGALRALSVILPNEFPAHTNWKMTETHFAFWELFPTIDHVEPVARGGRDDASNWVTTSMLRNSAKAHWTLGELGWTLYPPGRQDDWDGLSDWFVSYLDTHPDVAASSDYLRRWLRATVAIRAEHRRN